MLASVFGMQVGPVQAGGDPASEADHAAIIRSWDDAALERGRRLYDLICVTCHGNLTQAGSLPASRPFWLEPFQNGSDPFSIYRTLTLGMDQMPAWPWLPPEWRYDVIHYIRESFVKPYNPDAYFPVTDPYLAGLPRGQGFVRSRETDEFERGPKWERMELGPFLFWTLEVAPGNIAQKGIAIRLDPGPGGVSRGNTWMLFDHDTMRVAAAWSGDQFVDWRGIAFDGSHGTHASIVGERMFVNPVGPGWARPGTREFTDPRPLDKKGHPYGPLPRDWSHYKGTYVSGDRVVIDYTVGNTRVLESPALESSGGLTVISRTFNVGTRDRELFVRLAPVETVAAISDPIGCELVSAEGFHLLRIPPGTEQLHVKVLLAANATAETTASVQLRAMIADKAPDLRNWMHGGPARWPHEVVVKGETGDQDAPFAVDTIPVPNMGDNPWNAWIRPGGFDFTPDGRTAALCTWNGDVWLVQNIDGTLSNVRWKRIVAGLFQPLGLKIVQGVIHVSCRDQIARLHDLNGNGEIDWIESFNNDHQVTEHFHEFAMGLQTDDNGNFYYTKAARHALPALVPHHGTLLKVSRDGRTTRILANGFRAPNGVCLNPDGTFFLSDQEGHWIPKNRLNRVSPGRFYGNLWSYGAPANSSDEAMEEPVVWITNDLDRSPAEMLWVTSDTWKPLQGSLLSFSYGMGDIFLVPLQTVNGRMQGGVVRLPIERLPTGATRGRWHPFNGQLYVCGMYAWAGNQQQDGGFFRVRMIGKPLNVPTHLEARNGAMVLTFSDPLDRFAAAHLSNYSVTAWDLLRSEEYGSDHLNQRTLTVTRASLSGDDHVVTLAIPGLRPTRGMEILCRLRSADGSEFKRRIHNTIHTLAPDEPTAAFARPPR